jgi:biopolymer transport protein ExbD
MPKESGTIQFASPEPGPRVGIGVAPLVDIVFLLICFYLLVSQLITAQSDPSVQLPSMVSPLAEVEKPAEIVINLHQSGMVTVGGRDIAFPQLRAMLRDELIRAGQTQRPLRVVIRADRRQHYAKLDELLRTCRRAGVSRIVFRTLKKGGS